MAGVVVASLLYRIFFTRPFRIACLVVIGFLTAWTVTNTLTAFLACTPLAFNWNPTIKGGKCARQIAMFVALGVLDLILDCALFALPIPMIYRLKVSRGNKVALFGIFGLGVSTMAIACLRIDTLSTANFADVTFKGAYPTLWSFLEPAIGITVACGPVLGPLFKPNAVKDYFTKSSTLNSKSVSGNFRRLQEPSHRLIDYPSRTVLTTVTAELDGALIATAEEGAGDNQSSHGSNLKPREHENDGIMVKKSWVIHEV